MRSFLQVIFYPIVLASFWLTPSLQAYVENPPYTVIEDKAKIHLLAPTFEERKVLKLRLSNGLEAYIISDPKTIQSGALLSVQAGSWQDPKEYPGIAHFLEHMLFLGTKKYPNESEYASFVSAHDGSTNAFTASTYTSYLFSVDNSAFEEALDRFSDFFKDPLFNPSGVSRELQAIDQEYAKNLENDDIRLFYVDKELSNHSHPYHNFNMGNSSTLSKVSQDTLKKWYKEHYSANLMHLIVYSSLPLEKLKELVVADFQGIPNANLKPYQTDQSLYPDSTEHGLAYIEPIKNKRSLTLMWELPASIVNMKESKPDKIVCYILGHEGPESLLTELKKEGLAEKLSCGTYDLSTQTAQFILDVDLTDKGVKEVNMVMERIFQTINYLKKNEITRSHFDEIQRMATINYQYQPRQDVFSTIMGHADTILDENISTYPEQSSIVQKYDPSAIQTLLNLLTPQRAHYYLMAPKTSTEVIYDKREPWIGAEYTVKPIDNSIIAKWSQVSAHPDITLPGPNRLIPQQLSLVNKGLFGQKEERNIPIPETIFNDNSGLIYFASDTRYLVPQIHWNFEIKTPHVEMGNASKTVLADLYVKSVSDALTAYSYSASQAGLNYSIRRTDYGIGITIDGYSENADLLLDEIVKTLKQVQPSEEQFNLFKDSLLRDYQNFAKKLPIQQSFEALKSLVYKKFTTEKQKAAAIQRITYEKFKEYISHILKETYIEGMLYGNMNRKQADATVAKLFQALKSSPYPKAKQKRPEVVMLPENEGPFMWETTTKAQGNGVLLAIEYPTFDFKTRAVQQILMQAMKQPFFETLRTTQQTGYIVFSEGQEIERHLFNIFGVQSNTHSVRDLLSRFELFIEGFMQELPHAFPETQFKLVKQSLLATLEQPPKNIDEMGAILQKLAFDYQGDFDWISKRIQAMKDLTYAEFTAMAEGFMDRQNKRRVAILFKGSIPKAEEFNYLPIRNLNALRRLSTYSTMKR